MIRVPEDLLKRLTERATIENRTKSNLVLHALQCYIEQAKPDKREKRK
jgi:predicted transcriptional regulator